MMMNEKEANEIELTMKNVKNESFRKEIQAYQERIAILSKESSQLASESDKLKKAYLQLSASKYKAIEEIVSQKSHIAVLKQQIEMKQGYLSSLIKAETENTHKRKTQSEKIIKLISQISVKENTINQLIKKMTTEEELIALIQNPKETEYYLREILY